ncbi:MAG: hypothetical protein V4677_01210 [Bacteroidota bacterium]
MKKHIIFSFFISVLILSSCKKSYTCACTTNITEPGYVPYQTATVEEVKKNTSKKKATQTCNNTANQIEANTRLLFAGSNIKIETSCSLQEKQ